MTTRITTSTNYRVGLVGAGHISEFHVRALRRLPNVTLVGVTDLDLCRAQALAERFRLPGAYPSLDALAETGIDAVHVLTPPSSHAVVTLRALELGCHVLVEKPLATSAEDCERIASAARKAGRIVGVDHSLLCDPYILRALDAVRSGAIGDLVTVDYFRSQSYAPYPGGPLPPQYREGGYPFRDMGVHALYLMEAFLGDLVDVQAEFSSRNGDPNLLYNEWRVLVRCRRGLGQVQLSWNIKPNQNVLLLQGTRGVLRADLFGMTFTLRKMRHMPEFVQRAFNSWNEGWWVCWQVPGNVLQVLRKKILRYHGLQQLVAEFYASLSAGTPPLVTPERARPIVEWTERIAREADRGKAAHLARFPTMLTAKILVTGAAGFIGRHLVRRLLADGQRVRLFVRRQPDAELLRNPHVELVVGDLGDPAAVDRAVAGTELVYHVGASTHGGTSAADFQCGTVAGTRNVVESVLKHGVRKLVYVSSLSVLHATLGHGKTITEDWPLEPYPERRGLYTQTKLEAECIVRQAVEERRLPAVILRPGMVFGPGGPLLTPAIAQPFKGRLLILGSGRTELPLVYVDDVVDALCQAAEREVFDGSTFHLVDPEKLTQNDVVAQFLHNTKQQLAVWRLPRPMVYVLALGVSTLADLLRMSAPMSVYRVQSALARSTFDCRAATERLNWRPRVGVRAGLAATFRPPDQFISVQEAPTLKTKKFVAGPYV